MRFIPPAKMTELEKILIDALTNSCQPGCSHESCNNKNSSMYWAGINEIEKYNKKPNNTK